ncbi:MAG: hypothetical protein M3Y54_21365 [Bacteroidota bacterium]|nr:hypothetical protein [Bacteroidota bacterium]
MTATIITENPLPGLPSASGVEILGAVASVIGDDSPFLYQLDAATLAVTARIALFDAGTAFATGRLPKLTKPDLECIAALTWPDGRAGLLLLGSGSRPNRARGWFVPHETPVPEPVDLAPLYALLAPLLPAGVVLNLEAAATTATELLLFQRTVGRADASLLFVLPLAGVLRLFTQPGSPAPAVHQLVFALPLLGGCPAGFSGATFADGLLFVSASVEETGDAVLDGDVLGSYVGVADVAAGQATLALLTWPDGRPYFGKVEGLAVRRQLAPGQFELLLVTDDDAGGSTAATALLVL